MLLDQDKRLVASNYGVPAEQVVLAVATLQREHPGPGLRVLVDGHDVTDAIAPGPEPEQAATPPTPEATAQPVSQAKSAEVRSPVGGRLDERELATAELANHMLWESFKRSCQVQSYMLQNMTSCAVQMNQRFVRELETMRANYTKALEKIDGMQFEQRMIEHEAAARRLSAHHVRLAEEDHRAAERRREEDQSVFEQLARGMVRVIDVIGSDTINGKN